MSKYYYNQLLDYGMKMCKAFGYEFEVGLQKRLKNAPLAFVTPLTEENNCKLYINLRDLHKHDNQYQFVKAMIVLNHELHHIEQNYEYQNCNYIPKGFWDMLSSLNNGVYYNLNYSNMPFEIEAEFNGIINTYYYISEKYDIDVEKCILNYIDERIKSNDYRYLYRDFETCHNITDISNRFENLINKCSKEPRDSKNLFSSNKFSREYNLAPKMLELINQNDIFNILNSLPFGAEQSRFIFAYTITEYPEYRKVFKNKEIKRISFDAYIKAYEEFKKEPTDLTENLNDRKRRFADLVRKHESEIYKRRENYLRE